jgi:hypothetical protein
MRIEDKACREAAGSEKSVLGSFAKSFSVSIVNSEACLSRGSQQRTSVVPDHGPVALAILAVPQHAKVDTAVGSNGDARDDGRRQR